MKKISITNPERAEVHILDDEAAARAYIEQMGS